MSVRCGDGTLGWPEHAPFDAIIAAAGGPDIPRVLLDQLAIGGRLVMPIGSSRAQELVRVTRLAADEFRRDDLGAVRFVPLIGAHGWAEPGRRGVWPPRNPGPLRGPVGGAVDIEAAHPFASMQAPGGGREVP